MPSVYMGVSLPAAPLIDADVYMGVSPPGTPLIDAECVRWHVTFCLFTHHQLLSSHPCHCSPWQTVRTAVPAGCVWGPLCLGGVGTTSWLGEHLGREEGGRQAS